MAAITREDLDELLFEVECDLTALTFTILKLCGVINWAWFWVLFPVWALLTIKLITYKNKKDK